MKVRLGYIVLIDLDLHRWLDCCVIQSRNVFHEQMTIKKSDHDRCRFGSQWIEAIRNELLVDLDVIGSFSNQSPIIQLTTTNGWRCLVISAFPWKWKSKMASLCLFFLWKCNSGTTRRSSMDISFGDHFDLVWSSGAGPRSLVLPFLYDFFFGDREEEEEEGPLIELSNRLQHDPVRTSNWITTG